METQIYTTWLPLAIIVVFAIVGLLRGAAREVIVAASVVLAALINDMWGEQWGLGLHSILPNLDLGQGQFTILSVVLWLIVLVLGYGLGVVVPKGKVSFWFRIGGLLMGLASGAALAGLMLRYAYANLYGADTGSAIHQDAVSFSLMVWAGWYPIALAIIGAVAALIGPLQRSQKAVAQPSAASDWSTNARVGAANQTTDDGRRTMDDGRAPVLGTAPAVASASSYADTQTHQVIPDSPIETPAYLSEDVQEPSSIVPRPSSDSDPQTDTGAHSSFNQSGGGSSWLVQPVSDSDAEQSTSESSQAHTVALTSFGTQRSIQSSGQSSGGSDQAAANADAEAGTNCPNCGARATPGALFCTDCGTRVG